MLICASFYGNNTIIRAYKYQVTQILYMRNGLFLAFLAMMIIPNAAVAQSSLVLELRVNNTDHMVYVPGSGEAAASDLGSRTVFSNPEHYFIASYLSGLLTGMAGESGQGLVTEGGSGYHVIGFEQDLGEHVLLAFTQGNWETMDNRVTDIEEGKFMGYVSPSFAFGLGSYHPLKVALRYAGIDIDGSLSLSRGIYKLVIENKGQSGGRPLVEIGGS